MRMAVLFGVIVALAGGGLLLLALFGALFPTADLGPFAFVTNLVTVMAILFVVLVIAALVFSAFFWGRILDRPSGRWREKAPMPLEARQALGILDQRYASGEIPRDEYLRRKWEIEDSWRGR